MTREETQLVRAFPGIAFSDNVQLPNGRDVAEKCKDRCNQRHSWFLKKERKKSRHSLCSPSKIGAPLASEDSMKTQINPNFKAQLFRTALFLLLLAVICVIPLALGQRRQIELSAPNEKPTGVPCTPGWFAGPDMPSTGVRMVGVFFYPNFYAMGGRSMDGVGNDFTHPFEYDPGSNSWTIKSATYPDNQVSNMACGILTDSGTPYIYCVGGSAGGQITATDRVFRYNPVTDIIETIPSPWPGDADGLTL